MDMAKFIDHTLLRPDATRDDIIRLCEETAHYGFASACIASCWVPQAREWVGVRDISGVRICSVIGFPFGSSSTMAKVCEARTAVEDGADEIDVVINVGYLRSGHFDRVESELNAVVAAGGDAKVKVIIETCYLTDDQKVLAGRLVKACGADYVKTSTGYGPSGASLEDILLLRQALPGLKIKASGGIRTMEQAKAFIDAGASRIGTSAGPALVAGKCTDGKY